MHPLPPSFYFSLLLVPVPSCPSLTLDNGDISFSNLLFVGSVATHTCDRENGYVLSGVDVSVMESTRTCALSGWSGTEITCECKCIIMYLLQAGIVILLSYTIYIYRKTIPVLQ